MRVYIPNCYASWLQSSPSEGQVLIIAFLAKLHAIYGTETYFEMYTDDLDIINHTAIRGSSVNEIKKLKTLALIEQVRGIELRITLRLAEHLMTGLNRYTVFTDSIPYDLSYNGAMIWIYLMGRIADVDENTEIVEIAKVREYENSAQLQKYRGKEKRATTHILPAIYKDMFHKELGKAFKGVTEFKQLSYSTMSRDEYHKTYYQLRRDDVLARKRKQYQDKKKGH